MLKEFKEMNKKYNDDTYPMFPYISNNEIKLLKKGLYRKYNAKYRGVTAVYNKEKEIFEYPLYGMYYIPEDLIIIPDGLNLNKNKKIFLEAAIKAGYKMVNKVPTFIPVYFPEDSPEARLALANKMEYYKNSKNNMTI